MEKRVNAGQKIARLALWVLATLTVVSAAACQMLPTSSDGRKAGTVVVNFGKDVNTSSRTLVTDFASQASSYSVALTSQGGETKNATVTGTSARFENLATGTWNVSVVALAGTLQIGAGSLAGQELAAGASPVWDVELSGSQTGTGSFDYRFAIPGAVMLTGATAQLQRLDGSVVKQYEDGSISVDDDNSFASGSFGAEGIASGVYRLTVTYKRGHTVIGNEVEAVNVWDNVISNQFLSNDSGDYEPVRTYAVSDFSTPDWEDETAASSILADTYDAIAVTSRSGRPFMYGNYNVRKLDNGSWTTMGTNSLKVAGETVIERGFAVDSHGIPYFAYRNGMTSTVTVRKLDGDTWVTIPSDGKPLDSHWFINLAVGPDDKPYLVIQQKRIAATKSLRLQF